jgi:outer membrane protein OmpA-like peptidoglycan-associated protein
MKKSILHTAVHTATAIATTATATAVISATLLSASVLYAPASLANDEDGDTGYVSYGSADTDFYTEMFSNLPSSSEGDHISEQKNTVPDETVATVNTEANNKITSTQESETPSKVEQNSIQVARLGAIEPVIDDRVSNQQDALLDILTADLSLDVYFRSGSTTIESFYPARLAAIADLINTMDDLEIHLEGYTDRRGDKSQNIALANERIENVRKQLVDAGVDDNRIISKAFGEMKMVSAPGDLDGYTFDRKVVIRFQRMTVDSIHNMNNALSEMDADDAAAKSISPVVADAGNRF